MNGTVEDVLDPLLAAELHDEILVETSAYDYAGTVVAIDHTEHMGRIRVDFRTADAETYRARVEYRTYRDGREIYDATLLRLPDDEPPVLASIDLLRVSPEGSA